MAIHTNRGEALETALEKVGRSLSERFGITLVCQGNRCCTDGRTIYLPSLPDDVPNELLQVIRGWLDHEVAHHTEKTDMKVAGEFRKRLGPDAFFFLNILEDLRVEEAMRRRFPGSGYNLACCYEFAVVEAGKAGPLPPLRQLAFAVHTRATRQPDLPFVEPDLYAATDQIKPAVAQAAKCSNTRQVAVLAEEAWLVLEPLLAKQQQAQQHQPSQPENGQHSSEGNTLGQAQGSAPGQAVSSRHASGGIGNHTASHKRSGKSNSSPETGAEKAWRNAGKNPSPVPENQASGGTGSPSTAGVNDLQGILGDLGDAIAGQVQRYADSNQSYRIWSTGRDKVVLAGNTSIRTHSERMASVLPQIAGVRQRLLQTLLAEPKARWRGDLEKGDINPRALYRLTYSAPSQEKNPRAFRQKVRMKKLRTAVALLVDESNSMRHSRLRLAANTALVFCEALSRLSIATSVIGFSTASSDTNIKDARAQTGLPEDQIKRRYRTVPLSHTVYKRFDEQFAKVSGRMDSMTEKSLTPLGESMLFTARGLAARHEERKVLFVLTDGKPVVGIDPEDITFSHAKAAIKRIEGAGIDVALLGIMEPSVALLHHRSIVINRLDDLPRVAMSQLRKVLSK